MVIAGLLGVPVVDAMVDVLPIPCVLRGRTDIESAGGRDTTDFSASEGAECFRGLFGLLTLDRLCTPSKRSSEVAESDADPPMLKRRCQLDLRACPFFSGDLGSVTVIWDDDVKVPTAPTIPPLACPMSAFATLLERLRLPVALLVTGDEFLLCSTLSGTGGSTAPCPCVSVLDAEVVEEGTRGTEGAAAGWVEEEEELGELRFGDGVSRRGLLRERARWSAEVDEEWVAGSTNMVWLALSDRYLGPKGELSACGTMHGDGVLALQRACRCSGTL